MLELPEKESLQKRIGELDQEKDNLFENAKGLVQSNKSLEEQLKGSLEKIAIKESEWKKEKALLVEVNQKVQRETELANSKFVEAQTKLEKELAKKSQEAGLTKEKLRTTQKELTSMRELLNVDRINQALLNKIRSERSQIERKLLTMRGELAQARLSLKEEEARIASYEEELKKMESLLAQAGTTPAGEDELEGESLRVVQRVVLNSLLREICDEFRKDHTKNIRFELVEYAGTLEGLWNVRLLKRALLALVGYSISKSPVQGGTIELGLGSLAGKVEVTISAEGAGVLPTSALFQIFTRGGFGKVPTYFTLDPLLQNAKAIVERFSGVIWIESEVGVGTIFHVELPVSTMAEQGVQTKAIG
jgi:signal transduction histidine kinase